MPGGDVSRILTGEENEGGCGASEQRGEVDSVMRLQSRGRWAGRAAVAATTLAGCALEACAEGSGTLANHAAGNAYWSWALFALGGGIVLLLVFKGTRTR